ncbi:MAG: UDP-N-acetylmuramoyl-L-alanyl-D-glutamate--2,6-diaminopimelate ligase [Gammaproteobacteria bacterium]|nr:UDP-N-acetylmuramoyl-L-alanyl-D-glutamate--2,6-diaminopimelate ligase [Gammaproteobacteria bacterium]
MKLSALVGDKVPDVEVLGLTDDSRRVQPGFLFCAVKGLESDGHDYIAEAVSRGAIAVLCERPAAAPLAGGIPCLEIQDLAQRRGQLAAAFHGRPSETMRCVAVTGTNGKTSVAWHLTNMLDRLGLPAAYLGTIGWGRVAHLQTADSTTAGAIINQERLACLQGNGVRWAAMETSSHALDQGRVDDIVLAAAVFTNLTRDHLDYHVTMTAYGEAKRRLFTLERLGTGVINVDDPFGKELAREFSSRLPVTTFGRDGAVRYSDLRASPRGVRGKWSTPWGQAAFELPVVGEFSVSNAAAALATLGALGMDLQALVEVQRHLPPVPGRMQMYTIPDGPLVVVDYAHSPDALRVVLQALRQHCGRELVCVFGCGGDRDRGKRPMMAAIAEEHADVLWLTSDNPRSEDPEAILEDMRAGLKGRACVYECVDRADAIARAIGCCSDGDVVLVAGKGHEEYQELATGRVSYSDRKLVAEIMRRKAGSSAS